MRTRQSLILGATMLATLGAFMGPGSTVNGVSASAIRADLAARTGGGAAHGQGALARLIGSGGAYGSRSHIDSANGNGWSGVAAAKRAAKKRRNIAKRLPHAGARKRARAYA